MKAREQQGCVAGQMVWALFKPVVVTGISLLMLLMWGLMGIHGTMLVDYWLSERVYPADAQHVDPALEGKLVRVNGPLVAVDKALILYDNEAYPDAVEVQGACQRYAEKGLSLGQWQVQGLYLRTRFPFGYLHLNLPGVESVRRPEGLVFVLKSGAEVTLVGRQRANVLDMSDPGARATLGKVSPRYAGHIENRGGDFSLEGFEEVAVFAVVAYAGLSLLLGLCLGRVRLGWIAGASGLAVMGILAIAYACC